MPRADLAGRGLIRSSRRDSLQSWCSIGGRAPSPPTRTCLYAFDHEGLRELRNGERRYGKFCSECGAPLALTGPAGEHRKRVTIVFCDVTGSTALGDSADPEAVRALLARYFKRMKGIVERHGGTVEKFIGDAVMAVFGVPVTHEDDALPSRASCGGDA